MLPILNKCTFTGVDEKTNLTKLAILSVISNNLFEFGFLYSEERQGSPSDLRYPSASFIEQAFTSLDKEVPVALHICGKAVFDLISESSSNVLKLVKLVAFRRGRIQLNLNASKTPTEQLEKLVQFIAYMADEIPFIIQYNDNNKVLFDLIASYKAKGIPLNVAWLFDSSGGRGVLPEGNSWQPPVDQSAFGYAGGLGPDNLDTHLPLIEAVIPNDRTYWVDMEQKLRNDQDLFDLNLVADCAKSVLDFKKSVFLRFVNENFSPPSKA